jgi:hypothetical protein
MSRSPSEFFERWLPDRFGAMRHAAPAGTAAPPDVTIGVHLSGDGGGDWTLAVRGGALEVSPTRPDRADVRLDQSVADWSVLVGEGDGKPSLTPQIPSGGVPLVVDAEAQRLLAQLRGTMRFELGGYQGRTWSIAVTFNDAAEPSATIAVDHDTYQQMLARTLPPAQAYFSGKIAITGDVNLAMQVGMMLMSRMG